MDPTNPNHWRQMFERGRGLPVSDPNGKPGHGDTRPSGVAPFGFDDGYDPAREADAAHQHAALSAEDITDETAMALAVDAPEYKPWVLQRGTRPLMMLHFRWFDPRAHLWSGCAVAYPHLIAFDYTGDTMLSLDFGSRQFMIEGTGLGELVRHLQQGTVLMVQEYASSQWPLHTQGGLIGSIKLLESHLTS